MWWHLVDLLHRREDKRLGSDKASFHVLAGVIDRGMIMNVALGNLGDPVWFLPVRKEVNTYGNADRIGFNQAGKQQVRSLNPDREV